MVARPQLAAKHAHRHLFALPLLGQGRKQEKQKQENL